MGGGNGGIGDNTKLRRIKVRLADKGGSYNQDNC